MCVYVHRDICVYDVACIIELVSIEHIIIFDMMYSTYILCSRCCRYVFIL